MCLLYPRIGREIGSARLSWLGSCMAQFVGIPRRFSLGIKTEDFKAQSRVYSGHNLGGSPSPAEHNRAHLM